MIASIFGVELAGEGLLAFLDLADGLALAEGLLRDHGLPVDLVEPVQDDVPDVLGVPFFCLEEVGLLGRLSLPVNLPPDGLLALLPHLLAHKAAHNLKQRAMLHLSLHDDVALPDLILEVAVTDVLDVQTHVSLLLEAAPQVVQEVISPEVDEGTTVQFILDGDVVVIRLFFELHPALLAHLPSRAVQAQAALDELHPELLLALHVHALYLAVRQLADVDQLVVVLPGREGMLRPALLHLLRLHVQEAVDLVAVGQVLHANASVGGLQVQEGDPRVVFGQALQQLGRMHQEDLELNSLVEEETIGVRLESNQATVLGPILVQICQVGRESELLLRGVQKHRPAVVLQIMLFDLMQCAYEVQTILMFLLIGEGKLHGCL